MINQYNFVHQRSMLVLLDLQKAIFLTFLLESPPIRKPCPPFFSLALLLNTEPIQQLQFDLRNYMDCQFFYLGQLVWFSQVLKWIWLINTTIILLEHSLNSTKPLLRHLSCSCLAAFQALHFSIRGSLACLTWSVTYQMTLFSPDQYKYWWVFHPSLNLGFI